MAFDAKMRTQPARLEPSSESPTTVRYAVLRWLCAFSAIIYIGRVCIIQVQDDIQRDLHLSPTQFAFALSAFSLAYALFEVPTGWLGDRLGARKLLTRIMVCWVAFTSMTGAAWNLASMVVFRFCFGTGEAGAFPNIARASREWFPFKERGYAQGWVWMFARWGGAIAPFLMMLAAKPFGWRAGFVLIGALGLWWLIPFRKRFRDRPELDSRVNEAERALIAVGKAETSTPAPLSWSTMLRSPTLWSLSAMYFCSNAGWSFFASWITPYLQRDLKLSGLLLVWASGGPLFFGGVACMLGGSLTDRQVQIWGRRWGRTLQGVIAYGVGGMLLIVAVLATPKHVALAYSAICLSSFIKDFGMPASWATTIDVGHRYSGTVAGFMNTVGNLGQVVTIPVVAWIATMAGTSGHPAWKVSLYYYSAMFFIASFAWLFVNPRRLIVYKEEHRLLLEKERGN